jgi:hypothetical protein
VKTHPNGIQPSISRNFNLESTISINLSLTNKQKENPFAYTEKEEPSSSRRRPAWALTTLFAPMQMNITISTVKLKVVIAIQGWQKNPIFSSTNQLGVAYALPSKLAGDMQMCIHFQISSGHLSAGMSHGHFFIVIFRYY